MRKSIPTTTTTTEERLLEEETKQGSDEQSSSRGECSSSRSRRHTVHFADSSPLDQILLSDFDETQDERSSRRLVRLNGGADTDDANNNEWDSATTSESSIHDLYEMLQSDRIAFTTRKKTLDDSIFDLSGTMHGVLLSSDDFFFHGSWTSTSSSTLHDDDDDVNVDRTSHSLGHEET